MEEEVGAGGFRGTLRDEGNNGGGTGGDFGEEGLRKISREGC